MKENVVKTKSFGFAVRIVKLYQFLTNEHREYVISKQVLRCGTAVERWSENPNIRKAQQISFIN